MVTSVRGDMDTGSTSDRPVSSNLQKTSTFNDDSREQKLILQNVTFLKKQ